MSRQQYADLIEKLCKLSWLQDAAAIMAGGPIEVDGSRFSLIYNEISNPDALFIYCECGDPSLNLDLQTYRLLLKKNLFFYQDPNGPVFSISPDTDKIILVQRELLNSITAEVLSNKLILLSAQAKSWHDDLFQSEKEASPGTRKSNTRSSASSLSLKRKLLASMNHPTFVSE